MEFMALMAKIQEQFPQLLGLLSQPGIFKILADSLNDPVNWPPARVEAELLKTPYFQETPIKRRQFDLLRVTDPPTAAKQIEDTRRVINDLQAELGISFSTEGGLDSMGFKLLQIAVGEGWTPEEIKYNMLASVNKQVDFGGAIGAHSVDIKKIFDDYAVPVSDQAVLGWATKLAQGAIDVQAIQGYAQASAKSLFPGIADAIDRGISVRQYADPYLQIASQELGIEPENVSMTDPKWMRALNSIDPSTGQRVSMSLSDWTAAVRSDPTYEYDKTDKAANQAAGFAQRLGTMMGAIG